MAKTLLKVNNKAMATDGKLVMSAVEQVIPDGYIKPTGKIEITTTDEIDVSSYAKAQVIDSNLEPSVIKKDVTILGVTGTFEGGSSENTLKNLLDATKSAKYLFAGYGVNNISELIQYNDTENVTTFDNMFDNSFATSFPTINTSNGTSFSGMFNNCSSATELPLLDTNNGTNFGSMYYNCSKATNFPQIDTSKGTNFKYMYGGCSKATNFPQIDTSLGTSFSGMFQNCGKITSVPILNTSNGNDFSSMYAYCYNLKKVDISKFTSSAMNKSSSFCYLCRKLQAVIIRSFGENYVLSSNAFTECYWLLGKVNSNDNPNGEQGYIYVPRDMISILSNETNWSALQFRALEDYTLDGTTTGEFDDVKAGLV